MDITTRWNTPDLDVQTVTAVEKCAICTRRISGSMLAFHERAELSVPCLTWLLCEECASAVMTQLECSSVQSPLRIRIAVGMVAAERRPPRRPTILNLDYWEELSDQQLDRLLIAFAWFMFLTPPLVFLLVTVLTAVIHLGH